MYLESFEAEHFRNISGVSLEPHARFNILHGSNGQGKTNLLEGIYLLSAARSFRPQTNEDLIEFGHSEAYLNGQVIRGGIEHQIEVEIEDARKDRRLNGRSVTHRNEEGSGVLNLVLFGPEDLQLFKGSPSKRRSFIDRTISAGRPGYVTDLGHYEDVREQRNRLLKEESPDKALLEVYDEQLVEYGAKITKKRTEFLESFEQRVRTVFKDIFSGDISASLEYRLKWTSGEEDQLDLEDAKPSDIESLLRSAIEKRRKREMERGYTLVGPHRDDLRAELDGKNLKTFGSQGQHRAFVLSLKIAEIQRMDDTFQFAPIFLLDDVSSELDRRRNRYLFEFLREQMDGQVFITTTHRDHILLDGDLRGFEISNGDIVEDTKFTEAS
jgi:DNA replication and repair protein RecF